MSSILDRPATIELTALRAAFPAYIFNLITTGGKRRYEAVSRDMDTPLYCLISANAREIWTELAGSSGVVASQDD
jgi:hypothetical protein